MANMAVQLPQIIIVSALIVVFLLLMLIIVLLILRLRHLQLLIQSQPMYPAPASETQKETEFVSEQMLPDVTSSYVSPPMIEADDADALSNKRWVTLVEELVDLFDELDRHFASFDPARQELADHVLLRLQEILVRSGVDLIVGNSTFDSHRHKPEQIGPGQNPGTTMVETVSPGFAIGRRVLRRARVRLVESPQEA